jgi:hypothetical protein
LDIVNCHKSLVGLILGISMSLPAVGGNHEQSAGQNDVVEYAGVKASSIGNINIISPVTKSNFKKVLNELRQRKSLRALTEEESNAKISAVPSGTFFYAYGFQLIKEKDGENSPDILVNNYRGTDWHHFELHKLANKEIVLLGFATGKDAGKFQFYSKKYGPSPKLVPLPVDGYNALLIVPLRLIGEITNQPVQLGAEEVTALKAAVLPMN